VAIEGGPVEAGAFEDQLDRRFAVAALDGNLDQGVDDLTALGASRPVAGLGIEH
jgi:hypothetical protein